MFGLIAAAIGAKIIADSLMQMIDAQYDVILPEPEPPTPREVAKRIRRRILIGAWGVCALGMLAFWLVLPG